MLSMEQVSTLVGIAVAAWPVAKYVVKPISRSIRNIDEMSKLLGSNGGESLGDKIRQTALISKESRVRVDWLCDQLDRPVFECSPTGLNVRINDRFTDKFGYSPDEMLGQRWIRMVHPEDQDSVRAGWQRAIAETRMFDMTYRCVTRQGFVLRVRVVTEPNFDALTGDLVRWMGRIEIAGKEGDVAA